MKQFTVAIAGLGGRGYHTYAKYQHRCPQRMKIVAVAEPIGERRDLCADEFGVPAEKRFATAEELFAQPKLADVAIVATQDAQHREHALAALAKGYDVLLEKPVAMTPEDCMSIETAAKRAGRLVVVCHVLRYTAFFRCVKGLIDAGEIGSVASVAAVENVGYWHQAHSFVRGNWRNDTLETPMIVQKCCHDFDAIAWLVGSEAVSVSSIGSLMHFRPECAPEGSTAYCADCAVRADCPYNAYAIYLDNPQIGLRAGNREWPVDIVAEQPTEEKVRAALAHGQYGRCVYRCDNNVVDHQVSDVLFASGATASLTMTAFSADNYRTYTVFGTKGEIRADQRANLVTLTRFGCEPVVYDIAKSTDDLSGHGGGDNRMMTEMFDALENGGDVASAIHTSVHTHLMAFAAERSRLQNGVPVRIDEICGDGRKGVRT